jgi:hypothetical protein
MTHEFLSRPVTRREFALGSAAAAAFALLPARSLVLAQDATPGAGAADFASLGYPELKVTITDTGYEGIPDTLPAGRYLLTATAKTTTEPSPDANPPTVAFLSPTPAGMSAADFVQMFAPPAGASPEAMGSPEAMPMGSPEAAGGDQGGGEDQQLPLEIYQMKFAGGTMVFPGQQTAQAVIDLPAGEWVAWADDPSGGVTPATFTVTGDMPADLKDPDSDITATLVDFAITIEGNLTAGSHVIKVQHHGAQPHFLEMEKGPDTMTKEQVEAALQGEMSGTPAANGLSDNDLQPVFYSPTQSIGTVTWHTIDLPAGTLMAACFFPTAGTGVPHAMEGMVDVFKVTG